MVEIIVDSEKSGGEESACIVKEISIELPAGIDLTEEEMEKIASAAQNQIVDALRNAQAEQKAKPKKPKKSVTFPQIL